MSKLIDLRDGVSLRHFVGFVINSFAVISLLVYINALQGFLLTEVYLVPLEDTGQVSGQLSFADEMMSLVALLVTAAISDVLGRKSVVVFGYVVCAAALLMMPHGRPYAENPGDLIFFRLLYALGASALASTLTALLADYVENQDLGKAAGIMGVASGAGAVFTVFVLVRLPVFICLAPTYYVTGAYALLMGVVELGLLKPHRKEAQHAETEGNVKASKAQKVSKWCNLRGMKTAIELLRDDPEVGLSYVASFTSRGAAVTISVYITLWVNKYFQDNGLCFDGDDGSHQGNSTESACGLSLENRDKLACPEAFTQTSIVSGIIQTTALVAAPLVGLACDKIRNPSQVFIVGACVGAACFLPVVAVDDPQSSGMYGVSVALGFAQIFLVISSQWLVTNKMPADIRGAVSGFFSVCGGLGVIFFVNLGGYLFDNWGFTGPFMLVGIVNAISLVGICVLLGFVKVRCSKSATRQPATAREVEAQTQKSISLGDSFSGVSGVNELSRA